MSIILHKETVDRFGYEPSSLKTFSRKPVYVECICGLISIVPLSRYNTGLRKYGISPVCKSCARKKYASESEKRLLGRLRDAEYHRERRKQNPDKYRTYEREYRNNNETARIANLLRNSIRHALKRVGTRPCGAFRHLSYTPDELCLHIFCLRDKYGDMCPSCNSEMSHNFEIEHIIPLATAITVLDVIALFALDNLDLLCRSCNASKRDTQPQIVKEGRNVNSSH